MAQGAAHEKSQALARHLSGVRAPQLAARGGKIHAGHEGARARKRRGRHNLRKQIPQHDIIVTNYALLRRDLEEFQNSLSAR